MERCAQCQSQTDLRRCTACLAEWYCSRDCQRRHWKLHKVTCRKEKGKTPQREDAGAGEPSGSAEEPKEEERQKQQSKQSRKSRKSRPALPGPPSGASSGGGTPAGDGRNYYYLFETGTCEHCSMRAPNMKKCGRCQKVKYCSRDCQKQDWKSHKDYCKEVITTEEYRRAQQKEPGDLVTVPPDVLLSNLLGGMRVSVGVGSWEEARARARRLYPRQRVVDRFQDLDSDGLAFRRPDARQVVALVRIAGLYPHLFRHGRRLEDATGCESFVLFYNIEEPEPYFRYDQLIRGNFFCLEHAYLHFFADGNVGFRVDEPRYVHIMEP